jgi:hypothetical protein
MKTQTLPFFLLMLEELNQNTPPKILLQNPNIYSHKLSRTFLLVFKY